jgi:hypothetical protein
LYIQSFFSFALYSCTFMNPKINKN